MQALEIDPKKYTAGNAPTSQSGVDLDSQGDPGRSSTSVSPFRLRSSHT